MKLNWAERWVVNNPVRVFQQKIQIRRLRTMMPLPPGLTVLEIGCGRGAGAAIVVREFRPRILYAMDLDIDMIRKAQKYASDLDGNRIHFFTGDALYLPCRSQSLDALFCFGVLHHIPNWRGALNEIARVLKKYGVFFFEELYPSLYQNCITKHILLHPREDRFLSGDLKEGLRKASLHLHDAIEISGAGILGTCIKSA